MRVGSSTHEALRADEQEPKVLRETRSKTDQKKAVEIGRRNEKVSESLIEDIFLEIQEIHEGDKPMENVVNFVMDMAMEKVGAESGSVLFADVNGRELYFATARGPKANEIMDYRVPMGKGIVGFCTREGVSLAISDAPNDPRFYKAISESLGYETEGLVCAPIQYEGRVYGALELMNKKSGTGFTADEMNALSYMGRQLAQYVHDTIMRREKIE
ncbi:GAF domain-containing protein [Persicimonas caeni]|uniref:GAF domain-containing protein n=2 Tax=Persicimonas caeni TaxID=2292766 RepID=A0A4Y6PYJ9_PERCE|nr:GAF domain-containing protein [Persicimonas caeni]QED34617.1 GAF domain-containing protein [Persicimonas caeni]